MKRILFGLMMMCCGLANAQSSDYAFSEVNVGTTPDVYKANFAYALTNYVQWGDNQQGNIVIGVLGEADAVSGQLGLIAASRPITVENYAAVEDIGNPQLLFVAQTSQAELNEVLEALQGHRTIVVNATQGFQSPQVGVNLWLDGSTLKYQINEDAIEAAGLSLSDRIKK